MRFSLVFGIIVLLLCRVELKAVNDLILPQDSKTSNDFSTSFVARPKRQYVPLIDGQPIFIPEQYAEASEELDLEKKELDSLDETKSSINFDQNDKASVPLLEMDEVFPVDPRKDFKHPQKLTEKNEVNKENVLYKETGVKLAKPKPKPTKRTKTCKIFPKKIKTTDSKKTNTESLKPQVEKINSKAKVPHTVSKVNSSSNLERKTDFDSMEENEEHLSLQEEVKSMFGPSFKSFVFNPLAPTKSKFQECKTSKNESGVCRYVQHCFLPSVVSSIQQFMNNVCIIESRFIGVCCPEFPVQAVSVHWQDGQQALDETVDDQIKAPEECGVGTNTRIVGGSDANIKAYPWMVALLNNKKDFFCGGALINNRYVLTAAHCTFGTKNNEMVARVGEFDLRQDQGDDYRVVQIKRHGQYNRFTLRNDVALLKLEKPVTFNEFVKPICFPDSTKNYTGKIATLAGWGRLQGGVSPFTSDILQEVEFPIVTNKECEATHGLPIPDSLICTSAPSKDKSACNGDSGGPLMMLDDENRWKVVGVVSWGRRGCNTKFPSVFTRVTHYMDWIKKHAT